MHKVNSKSKNFSFVAGKLRIISVKVVKKKKRKCAITVCRGDEAKANISARKTKNQ